jgi:hypothetical protein
MGGETSAGDRETLTWEHYGRAGRELAQAIADDGYRPDVILSIARGGLFVAGSLLRGAGRGRALRGGLREAALAGEVRVRVEAHRSVDQLPVVVLASLPVSRRVCRGRAGAALRRA